MRDVTILVCTTCREAGTAEAPADAPRAGARLHAAVQDAAQDAAAAATPGARVVPVECLGNCKRACSVALSAEGSWTYVFGDLTPASAPDVLAAAALLAASADGLMPWRGRPDAFKRGMVARIPPLFPIIAPLKDAAE